MAGRTVTIELGGKTRRIFFDLNAVAEIGDKLKIEIRLDDLGAIARTPLPLSALRTVVWAGLRHEEPDLTEQQVGAWIHQDNIAEVFRAFLGLLPNNSSDGAIPTTLESVREAVAGALESVSG